MEIIKDDGTKITDQEEIKQEIRGFFEKLYREDEEGTQEELVDMSSSIPSLINKKYIEALDALDAPISEEEI